MDESNISFSPEEGNEKCSNLGGLEFTQDKLDLAKETIENGLRGNDCGEKIPQSSILLTAWFLKKVETSDVNEKIAITPGLIEELRGKEEDKKDLDLSGVNLSTSQKKGSEIFSRSVEFQEGMTLENILLQEAELSGSVFKNVTLKNIDLSYAKLIVTELDSVKLMNVKFDFADLDFAFLDVSHSEGISFKSAHLGETHLNRDFRKANFSNASFVLSVLKGGDFEGANFTASSMLCVDLRGANLNSTNFTQVLHIQTKQDSITRRGSGNSGIRTLQQYPS